MKILKRIIFLLLVLVSAGLGFGWYLYNKRPLDIREQHAQMEITAGDLLRSFQQDEVAATRKYVDKVLIVSGKVSNIQFNSMGLPTVFLGAGDSLASVACSFYGSEFDNVKEIRPGTFIRVKGNCTGILMDVVLNKCSMVQ